MKKFISIILSCYFVFASCLVVSSKTNDIADEDYIKSVINAFYDISYESWSKKETIDFSSVLDTNSFFGENYILAFDEINRQKKYMLEKGYCSDCFVPIDIIISCEDIQFDKSIARATVVINGNCELCYPWFVCLGDNEIVLSKNDKTWIITSISNEDVFFYTLNNDKFSHVNDIELFDRIDKENEKCDNITEGKTMIDDDNTIKSNPYVDHQYSASRAVKYAKKFVSNGNSHFYSISGGDCTNFISQCVSYGFGSTSSYTNSSSYRMTSGIWSAGSGGGFPAWESVSNHWTYMLQGKAGQEGPRASVRTWSSLINGDIMQIDFTSNGSYDHSTICVSKADNKFAQHTSNGYRYYSDYTGTKRFYHPSYFRTY